MKNRLSQLRKKLSLTQGEFGEKINLTDSMISLFESGKKTPQEGTIRLICLTFGVNEEWLRYGRGEMMDDEAQLSEQGKRLLALFRQLSPTAQNVFIDHAESMVKLQEEQKREKNAEKLVSEENALRGEADTAEKGEKSS